MQTKNTNKAKHKMVKNKFQYRLKHVMAVKKISQAELVERTGINKSMISQWVNGKVKAGSKNSHILSDMLGCDYNWLFDGVGEPFPKEDYAATESQPLNISKQSETFSMKEMVSKAMEILESETEYKPALATNIRVFHQAVTTENEMKYVQKELEGMKERMERMEEMLRSLGATVPEKRDKAANS